MYGLGLLKGLGLTLKHFWDTYTEDIRWYAQNRYGTQTFALRQGAEAKGIFTVEFPEERIAVPERFRFIPFLVVNNYDDPYAPGDDWCTSCGICAKVCPPQCIWIVRGTDPDTGRPKPQPDAFYIDIDICMNCGYCAEYCPFDAIKMGHNYALASYERTGDHIFDKQKLSHEFREWQRMAPNRVWDEARDRGHWEHRDVEKLAKKAGVTLPPPSEDNMHRATTVLPTDKPAPKAATAAPAALAAPKPAAAPAAGGSSILAAKELERKANAKEIKLAGADRKLIAAAKKAVTEAGLDWDNLDAAKVASLSVAMPAAEAAAEAAPAVAEAAPVAAAAAAAPAAAGLDLLAAKELERKNAAKEIKLTGDQRKQIAAAKKAAADAGLDWDNLDAAAAAQVAPVAAAPAAPAAPAPAPVVEAVAPAAPAPAAGGDAAIRAAKALEVKNKNKEIKLTGEDRKVIAAAKKAAAEAGIDWDSL